MFTRSWNMADRTGAERMSPTIEWSEYHLTPRGWEPGSKKSDAGTTTILAPADRVLSIEITLSSTSSGMHKSTTIHEFADKETIDPLTKQYGKLPP